jgi:hypothetical protein
MHLSRATLPSHGSPTSHTTRWRDPAEHKRSLSGDSASPYSSSRTFCRQSSCPVCTSQIPMLASGSLPAEISNDPARHQFHCTDAQGTNSGGVKFRQQRQPILSCCHTTNSRVGAGSGVHALRHLCCNLKCCMHAPKGVRATVCRTILREM